MSSQRGGGHGIPHPSHDGGHGIPHPSQVEDGMDFLSVPRAFWHGDQPCWLVPLYQESA